MKTDRTTNAPEPVGVVDYSCGTNVRWRDDLTQGNFPSGTKLFAAATGIEAFEQTRARTLLAHLWRRYDAAGTSMGRSHEAVVLEAVLSLLGDPDPADMALLDKDSGNLVNETRTYLSSKMAARLSGKLFQHP